MTYPIHEHRAPLVRKVIFERKPDPLERLALNAYAQASHKRVQKHLREAPFKADSKVVSVGNLVHGGTGKTPLVRHLVSMFVARGASVGVLRSPYGGKENDRLVSPSEVDTQDGLKDLPDEALMLLSEFGSKGVSLGVFKDRSFGAKAMEENCDVIVADDAFQFVSLARELDIVCFRAESPFGVLNSIEHGPLREPVSSLDRAGMIWISGADKVDRIFLQKLVQAISNHTNAPVIKAHDVFTTLIDPEGNAVEIDKLKGRRLVALSGVGDPVRFEGDLIRLGVDIAAAFRFDDHCRYNSGTLTTVKRVISSSGAEGLICTEKDRVKLRTLNDLPTLWSLVLDVEPFKEDRKIYGKLIDDLLVKDR